MTEIKFSKASCPLCHEVATRCYFEDKHRCYLQCPECHLVFVPEHYHLSSEAEKAEYDLHENSELTEGYQRFLERTLVPLHMQLEQIFDGPVLGLDYGCGEGQALSQLAQQRNLAMVNYDLYYHPHQDVLHRQYHFITMTEVLEHIAQPDVLMRRLLKMLKPNGIIAIMTKRVTDVAAFSRWHYKNDKTHICFYSEPTFQWLAAEFNLQLKSIEKDVVFLYKTR
ncbi:MAG: class I SAM-dependent methyltransferase [Aestuariibacter sp.]